MGNLERELSHLRIDVIHQSRFQLTATDQLPLRANLMATDSDRFDISQVEASNRIRQRSNLNTRIDEKSKARGGIKNGVRCL